jgi:hypothetical protein
VSQVIHLFDQTAFHAGQLDRYGGEGMDACPFPSTPHLHAAWCAGWRYAAAEQDRSAARLHDRVQVLLNRRWSRQLEGNAND